MSKIEVEKIKQDIRRRLFAGGKLPNSAEQFIKCPTCKGTGKYCDELIVEGNQTAELMSCPKCDGAGFIEYKD